MSAPDDEPSTPPIVVVPISTAAASTDAGVPHEEPSAAPPPSPERSAHADPAAIARQVRAIANGSAIPADIVIVYDDMHGLHGGETITVRGDGSVSAVGKRAPWSGERQAKLTPEELRALIKLLAEIQAWEQRVPRRNPVPDESRAALSMEIGGKRSSIWEWFNDLSKNARMVRVKERLDAAIATP